MILPSNHFFVVTLLIVGLLGWGLWANTFKSCGTKWRFALFYFDFAAGVVLSALILALTAGRLGYGGISVKDDLRRAGKRQDLFAFIACGVFNLGNMLLLGRGLPLDLAVHLRTSGGTLARRLPADAAARTRPPLDLSPERAAAPRQPVALGDLDISFYRDDVATRAESPIVAATHLDFPIDGLTVVIVDDVLYTGRTVRAAIEALFDYGRPGRVQLAVLADRGHRELPIRPDYVGKNIPTSRHEFVKVFLKELDAEDKVVIYKDREAER